MPINNELGYGNTAPYGEGNYKGEAGILYMPAFAERARDLIIEQYEDSEKFLLMIDAFSGQVQEIEDMLFELRIKRYLSLAEGAQLDGIGDIVGERRLGKNDDDYRSAINFRIFVNKSFGEMNILSNFLAQSLGPNDTFKMEESFPASVNTVIKSSSIFSVPEGIFSQLDSLAAGGVLINGFLQDDSGNGKIIRTTEISSDGSGDLVLPLKEDTGSLSEGGLGTYPPSEVEAGNLVEHILTA